VPQPILSRVASALVSVARNGKLPAMEPIQALSGTDLAKDLGEAQIEALAKICNEQTYESGTIIFEEGSRGRELYVVLEGKIVVEMHGVDGHDQWLVVHEVQPGEVFGEFALVDGAPRSARAIAKYPSRLLRIGAARFHRLAEQNLDIGYIVMRNLATVLCSRIRTTTLHWRNVV
jgi:CRP-like cAMP-binding protein